MSWDNVTLVILAAFGCVMLLLTQIAEVLSKVPEIIRAWHEVRRALQAGPDDLPEVRGAREADDSAPAAGEGNAPESRHCACHAESRAPLERPVSGGTQAGPLTLPRAETQGASPSAHDPRFRSEARGSQA
ncbi:hypothetical protein F8144_10210 [Streptomyces triticiradicis]|uniref:Uncharacterized protein n=1 Tax=Streptomyces triticiradicis TaxID=2651189 RepID=A0A7J5DJS3_9ACTN|nr:hypothetical protein F8144_10210 [Streptomyces triticiradicis]